MPTFAYEFNDDTAPARYLPYPGGDAHARSSPYLFDLPNAPFQDPLNADQQALAASMRAAWAQLRGDRRPVDSDRCRWPSFRQDGRGISLVTPQPQLDTEFAARHHCAFWATS